MESDSSEKFKRFTSLLLLIFKDSSDRDLVPDDELKFHRMFNRLYLPKLCNEAENLKVLDEMKIIPIHRLVELLNVLQLKITNAAQVSLTTSPNNENITQEWEEKCRDEVMITADAALCSLYILTSPNVPNEVYSDDIIGHIMCFIEFQLSNSIFPYYNGVQVNCIEKDALYNKIHKMLDLICELVNMEKLKNFKVEYIISTVMVTVFAENVNEIQLSCLELAAAIFMRYKKHRIYTLEKIFTSRLQLRESFPRIYPLNNDVHIQMFTVLILQLIQSVFGMPADENLPQTDDGISISNKYKISKNITGIFLRMFFTKIATETEEIDYKSLFKTFIEDLVVTAYNPKWPATEMILGLLGPMLVKKIMNANTNMSWRIIFLEYLGIIAARLQKDLCFANQNCRLISQIIKNIEFKQLRENHQMKSNTSTEEKRIKFVKSLLMEYLIAKKNEDNAYKYARNFYIAQWEKDANLQRIEVVVCAKNNKEIICNKCSDHIQKVSNDVNTQPTKNYIDCNTAELISQYLALKRSFSQNFTIYLRTILSALQVNSVTCKLIAMKSLTEIAKADPFILVKAEVYSVISLCFVDISPTVLEAVIILLGECAVSKLEVITKYYYILSARAVDTAASIRKRVLLVLKDICIQYPNFSKILDICCLLSKRLNDEKDIRKLVVEIFEIIWFTPLPENPFLDKTAILQKILNITNVVIYTQNFKLLWFEQLLCELFKPKEDINDSTMELVWPPEALLTACAQIVDCISENKTRLEQNEKMNQTQADEKRAGFPQRLVVCLKIVHLFAKVRPQLLVKHEQCLYHYFNMALYVKTDYEVMNVIIRTFKFVMPFIENPNQMTLVLLEKNLIVPIHYLDNETISNCISCLAYIVNSLTHNYQLIRECFQVYFEHLIKYKNCLKQNDGTSKRHVFLKKELFKRSVLIISLFLRHFDFEDEKVYVNLQPDAKDCVLHTLFYLLQQKDTEIQFITLKALGIVCLRHFEILLEYNFKKFYGKMLTSDNLPFELKIQVLKNIELYLIEEKQNKKSGDENLKEMTGFSSGMAHHIMPHYINEILSSYTHSDVLVRQAAFKVVSLVFQLGLMKEEKIIPFLICMATDPMKTISNVAKKHLEEIERKVPGIIHLNILLGMLQTHQFQTALQKNRIVRGYIVKRNKFSIALNHYLYSILKESNRNKEYFVLSLLEFFEKHDHTHLRFMLYLADNLAYFPYINQDEPLYIIYKLDVMVQKTATDLIKYMQQLLQYSEDVGNSQRLDPDEDIESLVARLPNNISIFQSHIANAQKILLLVELREYLKNLYDLNDKIISTCDVDSFTAYENVLTIRNVVTKFNPEAVINHLKRETDPEIVEMELRKDLIVQYLNLKNLIRKVYLLNPLQN